MDWKLVTIAEMIAGGKDLSAVRFAIEECHLDWEENLILAIDHLVMMGWARDPLEYFVNRAKSVVLEQQAGYGIRLSECLD